MIGSSRWSVVEASEALVEQSRTTGTTGFAALSAELFAVTRLLDDQRDLRRALSDGGTEPGQRVDLARGLLGARVSAATLAVVEDLVRRRWSGGADLVDATERLGALAGFLAAETAGTLDAVEDQLYRVGRVVETDPGLRSTLSDRWLPAERKVALLHDLFAERIDSSTLSVVEQLASSPRGRRFEAAVQEFAALASERHGELLAEAHVAAPLTAEQSRRLAAVLQRIYGRPARVAEVIDPAVLGGVRLVVGDEIIDGSVARRLEQARQQVAG